MTTDHDTAPAHHACERSVVLAMLAFIAGVAALGWAIGHIPPVWRELLAVHPRAMVWTPYGVCTLSAGALAWVLCWWDCRPRWARRRVWRALAVAAVVLDVVALIVCGAALAHLDGLSSYQTAAAISLAFGVPHATLPLVGAYCATRKNNG